MPNSVTVSYGRKRTDKLGDGSFDAVELGLIATVNDIPADTSSLSVASSVYEQIKRQVDDQFDAIPKHDLAVIKAVPQKEPAQPLPESRDARLAQWVQGKIEKETEVIQERMQAPQAMPGEKLTGSPGAVAATQDEHGTPPVSAIVFNEAVMYQGCRVFEVRIDTASNGNEFCVLRVGKRGFDGIPGQYTNARSFDGNVVKVAKTIREGDIVDVYGYFKPWKNNPEKFDLELQKLERSAA